MVDAWHPVVRVPGGRCLWGGRACVSLPGPLARLKGERSSPRAQSLRNTDWHVQVYPVAAGEGKPRGSLL